MANRMFDTLRSIIQDVNDAPGLEQALNITAILGTVYLIVVKVDLPLPRLITQGRLYLNFSQLGLLPRCPLRGVLVR